MAESLRKTSVVLALISGVLMIFGGGEYVFAIIRTFAIYSPGWWAILLAVLTVISVIVHSAVR